MFESKLIGHDAQRKALEQLLERERMPASLLFAGPEGVGKRLVACELAKKILCTNSESDIPCGTCESCRMFEKNSHPDFRLIEAGTDGLSTEDLRAFLYEQNLSSFGKGNKVSVINDADKISLSAANILLKTLEEPRPNTYFILIAANSSRLPWPVLSRCQLWHFSPLTQTQVMSILEQSTFRSIFKDVEPGEAAHLLDGSLQGVEEIIPLLADWRELEPILRSISNGDSGAGLTLASRFAKDKERIDDNLKILRIYLRTEAKKETDLAKKLRFAEALQNTVEASRLIGDRNLASLTVLNLIFLSLSGASGSKHLILDELVL